MIQFYIVASGILALLLGLIWKKDHFLNVAIKVLFILQAAFALYLLVRVV